MKEAKHRYCMITDTVLSHLYKVHKTGKNGTIDTTVFTEYVFRRQNYTRTHTKGKEVRLSQKSGLGYLWSGNSRLLAAENDLLLDLITSRRGDKSMSGTI